MDDRLRVLDTFLRLSLGEEPAFSASRGRRSGRLVDDGVFDWVVQRLEAVGPTEISSDSAIGPACVYETAIGEHERATTYLSTLAPWALVKTYSTSAEWPRFTGLHTVESPSVEVRPIVDIVASAGFHLAADGELAASSPYRGYDGAALNYFELLFQASGYFDSPWDTVLQDDDRSAEG